MVPGWKEACRTMWVAWAGGVRGTAQQRLGGRSCRRAGQEQMCMCRLRMNAGQRSRGRESAGGAEEAGERKAEAGDHRPGEGRPAGGEAERGRSGGGVWRRGTSGGQAGRGAGSLDAFGWLGLDHRAGGGRKGGPGPFVIFARSFAFCLWRLASVCPRQGACRRSAGSRPGPGVLVLRGARRRRRARRRKIEVESNRSGGS
jgi:hypothetical protein